MKDKKDWLYLTICLIGIFAIAMGLLHDQITKFLITDTWIVTGYAWVAVIGL